MSKRRHLQSRFKEASRRTRLLFLAVSLVGLASCALFEGERMTASRPVRADDPKGLRLPRGVPRGIDGDGNVIVIDHRFTTPQYQLATAQLLLQEANRVAEEMGLADEVLPITEGNALELICYPFGFSYRENSLGGVIRTAHYVYLVGRENKFNQLVVAGYDQACLALRTTKTPLEQMDTNAAFQLATQALTTLSMDVNGLNRECTAHIAVSPFWNGLGKLGQVPSKDFVPIYFVWWTSPHNEAEGIGGAASVELFLPTKRVLQLRVLDPKYVLRKPLVFTNLDSLFPGTGRVIVLKRR